MCMVTQGIWEMTVQITRLHFGALGLLSSHNLSTRWAHHYSDSASCFASCNKIGDVLENLHDIGTEMVSTSQHQNRSQRLVPHRVLHGSHVCIASRVISSRPVLSRNFLQFVRFFHAQLMKVSRITFGIPRWSYYFT